jgi:phosphopantetheinyl transferase
LIFPQLKRNLLRVILIQVMNLGAPLCREILAEWGRPSDEAVSSAPGQAARALLRFSAVNYGVSPDAGSWDFAYAPSGQPKLAVPGPSAAHISFSHSGDWVACGISTTGPIGIDIETHRQDRNLRGIAELSFGPKEILRSQASAGEFYRIWCIREAIAKATGLGFAQVTDRLDYADAGPFAGAWRGSALSRTWDLYHVLPTANLGCACATHASDTVALEPKLAVII